MSRQEYSYWDWRGLLIGLLFIHTAIIMAWAIVAFVYPASLFAAMMLSPYPVLVWVFGMWVIWSARP